MRKQGYEMGGKGVGTGGGGLPYVGMCGQRVYIVLSLCENACKSVCDVDSGIDPCPLLARSWDR